MFEDDKGERSYEEDTEGCWMSDINESFDDDRRDIVDGLPSLEQDAVINVQLQFADGGRNYIPKLSRRQENFRVWKKRN